MNESLDIVVVGGGIAALSAALYAARLGYRTLVCTGNVPGGLLLSIESIEGMPGFPEGVPGYDLCPMVQEQAAAAGASFLAAEADAIEPAGENWRVRAGGQVHDARAVIVATGARLRTLGLPAEAAFLGKGVSHCASCDAPLLRGRVVAVVGSGDSAMQEALVLAAHASRVVMLHRGPALTGQASYRQRVLAHERIEHRYGVVVTGILGADTVDAVCIAPTQSGADTRREGGADTRLEVAADTRIEVAAVFVYVGLAPNTGLLEGLVALDPDGRIPADAQGRTERRGLLTAGIVRAGTAGQAASAAGDAVTAAMAAHRYLAEGTWN